jgi:hypothetical protein
MKIHIFITVVLGFLFSACGSQPNVIETPKKSSTITFADATVESGINFKHFPTRTAEKLLPEIMGSGVAVADFNRDGAPDILLVNSGAVKAASRPADAADRLYLNNGKGVFHDTTKEWGLEGTGYGQGVAVGDFDNDGWTDVFLTNFEGNNRLLKNSGSGFVDVTETSGIVSDGRWATSAGFFDFDADGDLDLFIVRYVDFSPSKPHNVYRNRELIYSTPIYYSPVADQLWRNDGNGRFTNISESSGIGSAKHNGLALAIADIDKDGDQDIYVANDTDANSLWLNESGKFKDIAQLAGAAYSETGNEEGSMGADVTDTNGDGRLDIAVTNFQTESTSLYSQVEPLLFKEISDAVGIGESARQRLKFGVDFFDADNDGDEDLLVANGHIEDTIENSSDSVKFAQPNTLYEAMPGGRFVDISSSAGTALADVQVSRGLATADLNGDGLIDFVVNNNGGTAQVGFNTTESKGNFVILWLEGTKTNRSAIGTRVVAKIGDRVIERQVMGAQSYLSVSDFRLHFGLGSADKIDELTIYWLGGEKQVLNDIGGAKFYYLRQGSQPITYIPGERRIEP